MLNQDIFDIYRFRSTQGGTPYIYWRNEVWKILTENFFQKFVRPEDRILDIPCGFGEFINHIKCRQRIAMDIRSDSKKYLNPGVQFIKCESTKLALPDESVEKIFISNFFEHISREDIIITVKEAKRVLTKGGQVLVFQPNIRFLQKDYWMFYDHITPIDDRALEEVFGAYGLNMIHKIERFFPYTLKSRLPKSKLLVRLYLKFPILWGLFGEQSFLVFQKA